jgi:cobalt transporter subunit CbtB
MQIDIIPTPRVGLLLQREIPMSLQTATRIASTTTPAIDSRRLTAGATSMLLGSALLFLVGFAPISAVHNAAHDTRHSAAFPCH